MPLRRGKRRRASGWWGCRSTGVPALRLSLCWAFSSFFYLPFVVALEVVHLGFTYFTIDVIDQNGKLKRGRGRGLTRQHLLGRDNFIN